MNPAAGFSCGETIRLCVNGQMRTALVCGILDDAGTEPCAYMSCRTEAAIWPQQPCREMLLRLSGKAQLTEASAQLQKRGILVEAEPEEDIIAHRSLREAGFLFVLSIFCLICALVLLQNRQWAERIRHRDEILALSASGGISFELLFLLRNALLAFLSLLLATAAAAA